MLISVVSIFSFRLCVGRISCMVMFVVSIIVVFFNFEVSSNCEGCVLIVWCSICGMISLIKLMVFVIVVVFLINVVIFVISS